MGMSGEEYFETNPNDNSYDMGDTNNTNRDLITQGNLDDSIPVDMRSPDVTQIMENEKESLDLVNKQIAGRSPGKNQDNLAGSGSLLETQI